MPHTRAIPSTTVQQQRPPSGATRGGRALESPRTSIYSQSSFLPVSALGSEDCRLSPVSQQGPLSSIPSPGHVNSGAGATAPPAQQPPPLPQFASIPMEESKAFVSGHGSTAGHVSPQPQGKSTNPRAAISRLHSTQHSNNKDLSMSLQSFAGNTTGSVGATQSVSTMRAAAHTFASSNLPNLSFCHVTHTNSSNNPTASPVPTKPFSPRPSPAQIIDGGKSPRGEMSSMTSTLSPDVSAPSSPLGANVATSNSNHRPHRASSDFKSIVTSFASSEGSGSQLQSGHLHENEDDDDSDDGSVCEMSSEVFPATFGNTLVLQQKHSVTPRSGTKPHPHAAMNASTSNRPPTAKERSLQQHRDRLEMLRGQQDASNVRQLQAQDRRKFLAEHQNLRLAASWSVMVVLMFSAIPLRRIGSDINAQNRRRKRMGGRLIYPVVMLGMRRALRRARTRLLTTEHHYERPSLLTLQGDKILGLFPAHVLRAAAASMKLRYFFPNEVVIVIGCEDDEAYVLASGTADVMMGATKVFTMQPGMVFGTIGMISGEPRSASIFARGEGCLAWVMKRDVFDAAGDSATIAAAHTALGEVRQKNIMNVYKARLSPAALSTFPLLRGLADATLADLIVDATPRVVRRGTVLANPDQPVSTVSHLMLLKGRVSIVCAPPSMLMPFSGEERYSLAGEMRNTVDIPPTKGEVIASWNPALLLNARMDPGATIRRGVRRPSTTFLNCDSATKSEYTVTAPALLNVNSLFLPGAMMRPAPFVMTAVTDCDLLSLSRKTLRSQDVLELASIQQNALNAHGDFLGAPTKRDVARMLLDSIAPLFAVMPSAQNILATLRASTATDSILGAFTIEKWVYPRGGYLCFERSSEFLINIILDGDLEGAVFQPIMSGFQVWPQFADAWFAASDAAVRTTRRTVSLRIPRRDVLAWFCRALPDLQDLKAACLLLANSASTGGLACVLGFSTFDLDNKLFPEELPANVVLEASCRVVGRSMRGFNVPLVEASDPTASAVLRPALQYVATQLRLARGGNSSSTDPPSGSGENVGGADASSTSQHPMMSPRNSIGSSELASTPNNNHNSDSSRPLKSSKIVPQFVPPPVRMRPVAGVELLPVADLPSSSSVTSPLATTGVVSFAPTPPQHQPVHRALGNPIHSPQSGGRTFRELSKINSGNGSPTMSNPTSPGAPPTSPHSNPSPRIAPSTSPRASATSKHTATTTQQDVQQHHEALVDEWVALTAKSSSPGSHVPTARPGTASKRTASPRDTLTPQLHRPVQHQVDLSTLRGKKNHRRAGTATQQRNVISIKQS